MLGMYSLLDSNWQSADLQFQHQVCAYVDGGVCVCVSVYSDAQGVCTCVCVHVCVCMCVCVCVRVYSDAQGV